LSPIQITYTGKREGVVQTKKTNKKQASDAVSARNKIEIEAVKGGVTAAKGYVAAGMKAGIKESGKPDLAIVFTRTPAVGVGMFTTNAIRAASVNWCDEILPSPIVHAIVCNSGCANACTGKRGTLDNAQVALSVSEALGVSRKTVLVASTGVIGEYLPMERIGEAVPKLAAVVSAEGGAAFAEAIMTTDTAKKEAAVRVTCGSAQFIIGAAAKGSGMIHPNMATMLCFITTDANIGTMLLTEIVKRASRHTFNNLTVDGDTSTNDMALVLANGESGMAEITKGTPAAKAFEAGLYTVFSEICKKIAADGEGATKRVEVSVTGGSTEEDARRAAKAVAGSNLVKCALFGNDPNWGRIACAVGYSGAEFSKNRMTIDLCKVRVFENMMPAKFDEKKLSAKLKSSKVVPININLGSGKWDSIAQTCDFSYDYVKINADYRT
jgi:glutamate N-acetyltransferase/amino-acid N-acetyltransferase